MSKKVGERIRALRRLKRFTQQELADSLGISVSSLSNIERGAQVARPGFLMKIARTLAVSPEDLFILPDDTKEYSFL